MPRFDSKSMKREMRAIGYAQITKGIYKATWSSDDVEHFIYLESDSRRYLVARFGLRNVPVEEFGVASIIKYGHPNWGIMMQEHPRDSVTACNMRFEFSRIDNF